MQSLTRDLHLWTGGREHARGCRMLLRSRETLSLAPQLFRLEIFDLPDSSSALLSSSPSLEVRSAGSILAAGEILDAVTRTESGRKITAVSFSPGLSFRQASVSLSVPAGMTVSETIRSVLKASGTAVSLAAFHAEDRRLSRPQAFFGSACAAVSVPAAAVRADAFLSAAGLCVLDRSPAAPSLVIPRESLTQAPVHTADSVILSTAVTGWPLGARVRYTWQGADREGRLISRLIHADSVAGPWKSELELER